MKHRILRYPTDLLIFSPQVFPAFSRLCGPVDRRDAGPVRGSRGGHQEAGHQGPAHPLQGQQGQPPQDHRCPYPGIPGLLAKEW
jgi:hypothetical protein